MSEKVNIKSALRVFERITREGKKDGDGYYLSGLKAYTDFDGYTVTIENDYVRLDIYFHNKISFTFSNMRERDAFLEKIETMDKK